MITGTQKWDEASPSTNRFLFLFTNDIPFWSTICCSLSDGAYLQSIALAFQIMHSSGLLGRLARSIERKSDHVSPRSEISGLSMRLIHFGKNRDIVQL